VNTRWAARAADTEALLLRFNAVTAEALAAIEHADVDALSRALDLRDGLAGEIASARGARRTIQLEELTRSAAALQLRLELAAGDARTILAAQLSSLDANGPLLSRYASAEPAPDRAHLDVVL
jgi:hypothetical protein